MDAYCTRIFCNTRTYGKFFFILFTSIGLQTVDLKAKAVE
jgi:hypothetical protein